MTTLHLLVAGPGKTSLIQQCVTFGQTLHTDWDDNYCEAILHLDIDRCKNTYTQTCFAERLDSAIAEKKSGVIAKLLDELRYRKELLLLTFC
jgi:hypothetical protein